ncbi:PPA1309 family protein [Aeromicrobium sp. Leaf350]|uniref:PPA1309 family protein n=1 Tax=Aeromicrobium sp. Leaf350 TaxID=2876565 RepID=UPI001E46D967|nr:PPA1309 family protein [Aeromicrobium sp. Leaf350]
MSDLPPTTDGVLELHPDSPLRRAALEVEQHVAEAGWDQPPRLFALVRTAELVAKQPELAAQVGDGADGSFTPIEQEGVPAEDFEDALTRLAWPDEVHGCAAVIERVMLPQDAAEDLPEDPEAAAAALAEHPERQEVRLVAAVLREGGSHSAVRRRGGTGEPSGDSDLLEGPELVPGLVALLDQTLAAEA